MLEQPASQLRILDGTMGVRQAEPALAAGRLQALPPVASALPIPFAVKLGVQLHQTRHTRRIQGRDNARTTVRLADQAQIEVRRCR